MTNPDAAPTEMLSAVDIDELQVTLLRLAMKLGNDDLEARFAKLIAMARRSALGNDQSCAFCDQPIDNSTRIVHARCAALSEAAGKELCGNYMLSDELIDRWVSHVNFNQGRWLKDLDVSELLHILSQAKEATKLRATATALQSKLAEVEAENARLRTTAIEANIACSKRRCATALRDRDEAESRLLEVTAELEEQKKLSSAISRDCNATALERNNVRDQLAAANLRAETAWERAKEACAASFGKCSCREPCDNYAADANTRCPMGDANFLRRLKEPANGNG